MPLTELERSPLCRRVCLGARPADDSPAVIGTLGDGRKALFCICCDMQLRVVPVDEGGERAPNIIPGIAFRSRRFTCDRCLYDHVLVVDPRAV